MIIQDEKAQCSTYATISLLEKFEKKKDTNQETSR